MIDYIRWRDNKLSRLGLGTVQLGLDYGVANRSGKPVLNECEQLLNYGIQKGINCLDTARAYGDSETVIGNFVKKFNICDLNIISKIKSDILMLPFEKSAKYIKQSIYNLSLPTLFALLLHDSKLLYHWNDKLEEKIVQFKKNGLFRYFGVSIYSDREFELALQCKNIDIIQVPFNIFDQRAVNNDWLGKAAQKNILIFIRSIFLQGLLLMGQEDIPEKLGLAKQYLLEVDNICKDLSITKLQLLFSYVNLLTNNSIILFGCESLEQVKSNISIFENELIELDKETLKNIYMKFSCINEKIYNPIRW